MFISKGEGGGGSKRFLTIWTIACKDDYLLDIKEVGTGAEDDCVILWNGNSHIASLN